MPGSLLSALSVLLSPRQGALDHDAPETAMGAITFKGIDGNTIALSDFAGNSILIVNTASKCGFRQQLGDLEILQREFHPHCLQVLCLPSNDFGNQEPGNNRQICETYRSQLNVSFAVTEKIRTRGKGQHPFFQRVHSIAGANAIPKWNFYKYIITGNGHLAAWFATSIRPTSPRVREKIEACS